MSDELLDRLAELRVLADPGAGTTINCGAIRGGTAANVVAERAEAAIDVRVPDSAEGERVRAGFAALEAQRAGAALELEEAHSAHWRSPPPSAPVPSPLCSTSNAARDTPVASATATWRPPRASRSSTEGPCAGGPHAIDEHIDLDSMVERAALIALLLVGLESARSGSTDDSGRAGGPSGALLYTSLRYLVNYRLGGSSMTTPTEHKPYTSTVKVANKKPTLREVTIPGADEPMLVGFHREVAEVYKIPDGAYEEAPATYDYLVGAVAGCLTGVLSGMLEARTIPTGDDRLSAQAVGKTEWQDRVLRVTDIHVHYVLDPGDADRETIERLHDQHVKRCSMAQSVAGAIDVTTSYELA